MAVPVVWSDLHYAMIQDSVGALKKVTNIESVMTSIDNILGTRQGQRVMLPEFASTLGDIVFERIDQDLLDYIGRKVREVIERWDDRVAVTGVDFNADPDRSFVSMSVSFRVRGYDKVFQFTKRIGGG